MAIECLGLSAVTGAMRSESARISRLVLDAQMAVNLADEEAAALQSRSAAGPEDAGPSSVQV